MEQFYKVSSSPHIRSKNKIETVMRDVLIALLPATIFSVYYFGIEALMVIIVSILSCIIAEYLWQKITKQKVTINDYSAVITGLLLAFNVPSSVPLWLVAIGGFFAIIVVKQIFGGLGQNFVNPALAARAFLLASWPTYMTIFKIDGITTATPLAILKEGGDLPAFTNVLFGTIGGCIGETSAFLLIVGGIYLIVRKVINYKIPVTYIATVFILTYIFGGNGFYEIFAGGLILGAFYMATDYSTSPVTPLGQIIMGIGCGVLTTVIRKFGGYAEGVSYSILIMNLAVPLIDRYTKPRIFGEVKK